VFDLDDSPAETGHGVAQVNGMGARFPLTLKPVNEMTFSGWSFKPVGNSSTFPNIHLIGWNEPFAVHFEDPNSLTFFANPAERDKGIYAPTVNGHNHGRPFQYRASLPLIARDRLHDCGGGNTPAQPDTFYKIPLSGVYSVSQGNNGDFTHKGTGRFAWDFPNLAGTPVLAARGGRVIELRESASQSCWNWVVGDCVNCTGSADENFVKVRHRDGTVAVYVHFLNNGVLVSLGQRVFRGDVLGLVGSTGCSTGNHLHFEVLDPDQTTTIPARFESYTFDLSNPFDPFHQFAPCHLPPGDSLGRSTQ
jgi:murein DD-endopeptidase MepM/ murein hydrolase activator NlpD